MNIRTIFLTLLFLNSLNAFSQINSIKGIVVSNEYNPIEFANVVLSDNEGKIIKGTITDSLGRFHLALDEYNKTVTKILSVSYLGYESHTLPVTKENVGTIILYPDSKMLQGIVVTASRSPYTMKGTTLIANVQKSILKDAGDAVDVLKQLPLINVKNDIVTVFGKGNALIYINNREVRNIGELQRLSSKNIKKMDIITMPGAQYSASTGAVIKIYTIEQPQGFSGLVHTKITRGKNWNESFLTNVSYAKNRFILFADYSIKDLRKRQQQHTDVIINGESKKSIHSDNQLNIKRKSHNFSVATEYKISQQHILGVKYNHAFIFNGHYNVFGSITAYSNTKKDAEYNQLSDYYPKGNNGNINLFYNGKISKWSIDLNADYTFGHNKTLSLYDNTDLFKNVRNTINSKSENNYRLCAVKLELSRQIENSMLSVGADYAKTYNRALYRNDDSNLQKDLPPTITSNNQDLFAIFLNYRCNLWNFDIETGVRYEFINRWYNINGIRKEEQSKRNSNFFPTASISRTLFHKKINMALSYRRIVRRPSYYQLRGDVQYNSPYSYEAGNPLLQNTYIDDISYTASYLNINLMASYKSYHNKTIFTIEQYEDKPITISHFTNVNGFKKISIAAIWDPTFFKIWNPEVEVGFERQLFKVINGNEVRSYNRPYFYTNLYNILKLPANYTFVVQAKYWSSYNSGVSYEKGAMFFDTFIQKSLCNRSAVIKLGAENIFNTNKDKWKIVYKNINYEKWADNDNRFIFVSFTYNLHKAKKYTGKGTRNSEQKRLNTL